MRHSVVTIRMPQRAKRRVLLDLPRRSEKLQVTSSDVKPVELHGESPPCSPQSLRRCIVLQKPGDCVRELVVAFPNQYLFSIHDFQTLDAFCSADHWYSRGEVIQHLHTGSTPLPKWDNRDVSSFYVRRDGIHAASKKNIRVERYFWRIRAHGKNSRMEPLTIKAR